MTNKLTADGLRELVVGAFSPNQLEWYLPWRVVPDAGKPTIVGSNSGNLFRGYIGTWSDADLIVALVNAAPQIIALMEREARMREALGNIAEGDLPNGFTAQRKDLLDMARAALQPKETDDGN